MTFVSCLSGCWHRLKKDKAAASAMSKIFKLLMTDSKAKCSVGYHSCDYMDLSVIPPFDELRT